VSTLGTVSLHPKDGILENTGARRNKLDFIFYARFFTEITTGLKMAAHLSGCFLPMNNLAWKGVHFYKFLRLKVLFNFRYVDLWTG